MRYISVCSGIEAASVAWEPLGWKPAAFSEIEKFPCRVLKHRFPDVPNRGDMTKFEEWPDEPVDLLVGGTPCQSFSVAGKRGGMDDPRGQLAFAYAGILAKYRPRWLVWENVPGVLSSNKGRDFASFVRELVKLGYGVCWRMLDAQHFGVPQRRKRIFAVGYLGDWRLAAAVLFERQSCPGDFAPGGKTGERIAGTIAARFGSSRNNHEECVAKTLLSRMGQGGFDMQTETAIVEESKQWPQRIAPCLDARFAKNQGQDNQSVSGGMGLFVEAFQPAEVRRTGTANPRPISPTITSGMGGGDTVPRVLAFPWQSALDPGNSKEEISPTLVKNQVMAVATVVPGSGKEDSQGDHQTCPTLKARMGTGGGNVPNVMAVGTDLYNGDLTGDVAATISTHGSSTSSSGPTVMQSTQVRRLTPKECERLQGFPDDWTNIPTKGKDCPDGPRYKALGNSMAVPVMAWIGRRLAMVANILEGNGNAG